MVDNTDCPICGNNKCEELRDGVQNYDSTLVLKCNECDFEFLSTYGNLKHVKSLYEGDKYVFQHNVSSNAANVKYNEYDERYDRVKPYLGKTKSLLEIGCGDGKFLRMVKNDVYLAEGVELSPPQVQRLRDEGFTCYDVMIDEMQPPRQYDIICMFALLEHVPLVRKFLNALKKYMHHDTDVFIEVPNLSNALVKSYDIEEFRKFYYRAIHLYYFNPVSLKKLLDVEGFKSSITTSQQASITNHFHWMYNRRGQENADLMTSVVPPVQMLDGKTPILHILDTLDDEYRKQLEKNDMGDLLSAHVRLSSQ